MTALKEFRHDLAAHLADGLSATAPALGKLVNPPAVVVQSGSPYVEASDYCMDALLFDATVIAPPGDPSAVIDALDDLIDLVRATLRTASSGGHRYGFRQVSELITYPSGEVDLPARVVTIGIERVAP